MTTLFQTAQRIQDFIISRHWKFCFIGGIALQRWGETRLTRDVDISLLTGFQDEIKYINAFDDFLLPRIENHKEFALENRVILLKTESGIGIDITLAGIPFEEEIMQRATYFQFLDDVTLLTCSAEDLIVMKAFASRDKDWGDIQSILVRQQKQLNWPIIIENLEPLAQVKNLPDMMNRLDRLKKSVDE